MERDFDIILYGATGYTGEITAEYIAKNIKNKEKWAISGRSKEKLQKLQAKLQSLNTSLGEINYFVCDVNNPSEIRTLASKTRVLINCVGPYRIYGEAVVTACLDTNTDYVDVTGEPPFFNSIVEKYHEEAKKKKVYILPACGIGSLIPDVAVEAMKNEFSKEGIKASSVTGYLKLNGRYAKTFSNGTWNTFVNSMSNKKSQEVSSKSHNSRKKKVGIHLYKPLMHWAIPFVEGADLHVIRRTNYLTLNSTGNTDFNYSQFTCIPLIPPLWLLGMLFMVLCAQIFSKFSITRKILLKREISDGGPTKEQRRDSSFDFYVVGKAENSKQKLLHVHGPSPYDTTAIAAAECSFSLINEREEIKQCPGVSTPGVIMTEQMLRRLPCAGVTFVWG